MGGKDIALFERAAAQIALHCDRLDLTQVADALWAFATVQVAAPELLSALAQRLHVLMDDVVHVDVLGDLMWALGRLKAREPDLVAALCSKAEGSLGAFEPEDMAALAWSCASLGHHPHNLFAAVAVRLAAPEAVGSLSEAAYGDLLWAMMTVRHYN